MPKDDDYRPFKPNAEREEAQATMVAAISVLAAATHMAGVRTADVLGAANLIATWIETRAQSRVEAVVAAWERQYEGK